MAEQLTLLIWESEVKADGENRAVITARKPVFTMSIKQAAKVLRCEYDVAKRLYRNGILSGNKPGGYRARKDGKKSNAKVMLDTESVLKYKESIHQKGVF